MRRTLVSEEMVVQMVKLREQGHSQQDIANRMGVAKSTVFRYLKLYKSRIEHTETPSTNGMTMLGALKELIGENLALHQRITKLEEATRAEEFWKVYDDYKKGH